MKARAELELLLSELLDSPPDEARNRKLQDLLRANPDLQGEYLDHLRLHALLQWRAGRVLPKPESTIPGTHAAAAQPSGAVRPAARWWSGRNLTIAASIAIAASVGILLYLRAPENPPSSELVGRLIEWNLDLTQAQSREERQRIYTEQVNGLKATLARADLPREDREWAEMLLENSHWLTRNNDPTAEADRFSDIADKVVARMDEATAARDEHTIVYLANTYRRLADLGIDANLQRAIDAGDMNQEREKKFETALQRDTSRVKKLTAIMDRSPEMPRKAIHHAMKRHPHKMKKHHKSAK